MRQVLIIFILSFLVACGTRVEPPKPFGPVPTSRQLDWQKLEFYAFVHFNMNTFTNMEWGYGDENPDQFNPTELDTRQWAKVCRDAGMKGIIITAKHHDGFCLWPSEYTEHSVKNSSWKNGQGDVIQELADACKEYGLKLGIYLSPWDRNHADYGKPEYVDYFKDQLRELLTNYGDIYEVWFDGANGGDGYYGGANETRKIDARTYYQWPEVYQIVRELQPNAVIFGDGGPDIRWVGNEEGWANPTNWSLLRRDEIYPGWPKYIQLRSGHEDGTHWVPAECNTSIRPGWYYHPYEDHKVKTLPHLVDIYYKSVGRNGNSLINLPVDTRGLVHEKDAEQLLKLAEQIKRDLAMDLTSGVSVSSSNTRGNDDMYQPLNLIDGNPETYWATDDTVERALLEISFNQPTEINTFLIQEYIPLGQRVVAFKGYADEIIDPVFEGTTVGNKRILRFETISVNTLKIEIEAKSSIVLSNLELYNRPALIAEPVVTRSRDGIVSIEASDPKVQVLYTIDSAFDVASAVVYEEPFALNKPAEIHAVSFDPGRQLYSDETVHYFDVPKAGWSVVEVSSGDPENAQSLIDSDPETWWISDPGRDQSIAIDLGSVVSLKGFTYYPMQDRWINGVAVDYRVEVSKDGKSWEFVSEGQFSNILNNPIEQRILFDKSYRARFIRFTATRTMNEDGRLSAAEIGVITR